MIEHSNWYSKLKLIKTHFKPVDPHVNTKIFLAIEFFEMKVKAISKDDYLARFSFYYST